MSPRRRVLRTVFAVLVVVGCCLIVGLSIHIVDTRNARNQRNAAVVAALAREQHDVCVSQATTAQELNAVLDYVKHAGSMSTDPATLTFIAGLPYATVPAC